MLDIVCMLQAVVHLTDERRQQKEALRQSNMASVFERLHHSFLEADNAVAQSPHRTSGNFAATHAFPFPIFVFTYQQSNDY
ncbi:hypothetical protein PR048_027069 [Dryococelus australis]|uniref:Uncharacterized protein n=1 Tax=Dryococelus australis TaxID=614101 RepID=A0ABQ9GEE7_9NEOP|nr:hypothetical protein PR048_027069 [Dryococelus australis]